MKEIGVRSFIQQGALVELLSDWLGESFPLYALYPSGHLPAAKVRAFIDFVQSHVALPDGMTDEAPGEWRVGATPASRERRIKPAAGLGLGAGQGVAAKGAVGVMPAVR